MASAAAVRVGIDLVDIDDVRESLRTHGDRYLRRIYTEREIEDSRGRPERLAAVGWDRCDTRGRSARKHVVPDPAAILATSKPPSPA